MEYRRYQNTIVLRLDRGEEILEKIREAAVKEKIVLAEVNGIGAVSEFTAGGYSFEEKGFTGNTFKGTYEIVSLTGNITTMNDEYYGHFHIAAADLQGHMYGGHLTRGIISATGEIMIRIIEGRVDRLREEETGINLLKF